MSIETELPQGEDTSPEPIGGNASGPHASEGAGGDNLARSVMAKAAWGQQVLSPWVQRQLDTGRGSRDSTPLRQPRVALTLPGTNSLLGRLQRAADNSRVWRPNIGSLNPLLVNNFTETIIHRFQDTSSKITSHPSGATFVDETELPLAGVKAETTPEPVIEAQAPGLPFSLEEVSRALRKSGSGVSQPPASPAQSPATEAKATPVQREPNKPAESGGLPFSLAEVRAALEKPHFTQASEHPIQRVTDQPATSPAQPPGARPSRRVLSRVEEVTPTAGEPHAGRGISEPTAGQPGGLPPRDIPPAPPQVQRQIDAAKLSPEPAETPPARTSPTTSTPATQVPQRQEQTEPPAAPPVEPMVVEVVPFPTRPRRERPTIIPAVQRQAAEAKSTPEEVSSTRAGEETSKESPEMASPGQTKISPERKREEIIQPQPETDKPKFSASTASELAKILPPETQRAPIQLGSEPEIEPVVERQPDTDMPLRETASASTPAAPAAQVEDSVPVASQTEPETATRGSQRLMPTPEATIKPVLQRQSDLSTEDLPLDLPLREVTSPSTTAEAPASPPTQGEKPSPVQPQREIEAGPRDSQQPPAIELADEPILQRQPDLPTEDLPLDMPLREVTSPSTTAETPASPPAQGEEPSPVQPQREIEAGTRSSQQLPATELADEPILQRQTDLPTENLPLDMPLREAISPVQAEETPPVQTQREVETGPRGNQQPPATELADEPILQRQSDLPTGDLPLDMPLREAISPSTQGEESSPIQTQREVEAGPKGSQQPPAIEAPASPPTQGEEPSPVQPQREIEAGPRGSQPLIAQPELPVEPALQRQPDLPTEDLPLDMPLREAASPVQAEETPPVQPQREAEAGPKSNQQLPATELADEPILQRQPDLPTEDLPLDMPLREAISSSTQGEESSPIQTQREVEAGPKGSQQLPATELADQPILQHQPDLPTEDLPLDMPLREVEAGTRSNQQPPATELADEPILQRQPDLPTEDLPLDMPLREAISPSTPAETPVSPPAQGEEPSPVQPQREVEAGPKGSQQLPATELADEPILQRQPDLPTGDLPLDMPLREATSPPSPVEAPVHSIERQVESFQAEAGATIPESPSLPTAKLQPDMPLREGVPASIPAELPASQSTVQRRPDLPPGELRPDIPLKEPGFAPPPVEERREQGVEPEFDLPLRQPAGLSLTNSPEAATLEGDLSQNILSKARTRLDLPLVKPATGSSGLIQSKSGSQMAALPQARFESESNSSERIEAEPPLLAMPYRVETTGSSGERPAASSPPPPVRPAAIQRQPATPGPISQSSEMAPPASDLVQREETTPVTTSTSNTAPAAPGGVELERLARQILPEIKRLLARERDRQSR